MQPSRRAFLMGRRPVQTPWATFLQRLGLLCQGAVRDLGEADGLGPRAVLAPTREADVTHARTLCAEYGVVMALDDVQGPFEPVYGPMLRLDPSALSGLARLTGATPRWRAQPGVPLAALALAGLPQFDGLPAAMTLAQWLAAPALWPTGQCAASGVVAVDLMLADGVEETLGPFGTADVQPLQSATVQRLIPSLFQLSGGAFATGYVPGQAWGARYRLDALAPQAPATVNLAHLLLGHGGTLAWVQGVTLEARPGLDAAAPLPEAGTSPQAPTLQNRIKALFDPYGRFPEFQDRPNSDDL